MPNIQSAKKRVRVTERKTLRNRMVKSAVRTDIKKFESAVAAGDSQAASEQLRLTVASIDRAASKGIFHKKTADRKKSRMAKKVHSMAQ